LKSPESNARISKPLLAGGAFIVLATLIVYLPALGGGFIWDDDAYVTANKLLTAPDGWWRIWFSAHYQSQYFPLVYTTLRVEHALWGLNPLGYHLVNVLLHAANALLVWAALRRLAIPGAWLASSIFALHPVQVETAAWITELKNTQSTLFYLLALLAWIRFTEAGTARPWRFYALALALYQLALFSKTTACTLPAAMALVLWLRKQPIDLRRAAQIAPFFILGVAMGLLSVWWEGHLGNYGEQFDLKFSAGERLLIAPRALWFYLGKLVWPANLTFSYPRWDLNAHDPVQYVWAAGALAAAGLLWWKRAAVGRGTIAAMVFYVATLSPMLGLFSLFTFRYSFVADHYQYLACLGPIALVAAGLHRLQARWPAGSPGWKVLSLVLVAVCGVLTWRQAGAYRSAEALWRDTLKKNPASWMAHNNLGLILKNQGKTEETERHYRKALQIEPGSGEVHYNLGLILKGAGKLAEAEAQYREALRLKHDDGDTHYNLANLLAATDRRDGAIGEYQQALRFSPEDADIHNNLGVSLYYLRRFDEAMAHFREALRLRPNAADIHCNLGNALLATHQREQAVEEYTAALRLDPEFAEAKARLRALGVAAGP
jgi:protein O-mannosyl-transferase